MAGEKVASMNRRKQDHDYHSRRMYMITMTLEGRLPLLGSVVGNTQAATGPDAPHTVLTELGKAVEACWKAIPKFHPEVSLIMLQMMPDHLHGILFVERKTEMHLGMILRGFKLGCNKAFKEICPEEAARAQERQVEYAAKFSRQTQRREKAPQPRQNPAQTKQETSQQELKEAKEREPGLLFSKGYNDRILLRDGQLETWKDYLADNPRRLLVKRENPELFRVQRALEWKGMTFSAIGNRFLLQRPWLVQVQCSRMMMVDDIEAVKERMLEACRQGAVLVSPSISHGEKTVMRAAFEAGFPVVVIKENGFAPLAKPAGKAFDACAAGRLLLLGPTWHSNERKAITRGQCLTMNEIARRLCE